MSDTPVPAAAPSVVPAYTPWIVCAALRFWPDAESAATSPIVICGPRHYDETMRRALRWLTVSESDDAAWLERCWRGCHGENQGFVDQRGVYYDRAAAYSIALANGQIRHPGRGAGSTPELYSEQLY